MKICMRHQKSQIRSIRFRSNCMDRFTRAKSIKVHVSEIELKQAKGRRLRTFRRASFRGHGVGDRWLVVCHQFSRDEIRPAATRFSLFKYIISVTTIQCGWRTGFGTWKKLSHGHHSTTNKLLSFASHFSTVGFTFQIDYWWTSTTFKRWRKKKSSL